MTRLKAATDPSSGSKSITATQGREERRGRLNVARAAANLLTCQISALSAASAARDAGISHKGNRHWRGSPSSESTRADEMPLTPGGAVASNTSSAEAKGPWRPALARTAAPSAFSSARSASRATSGRSTGTKNKARARMPPTAKRRGSRTSWWWCSCASTASSSGIVSDSRAPFEMYTLGRRYPAQNASGRESAITLTLG